MALSALLFAAFAHFKIGDYPSVLPQVENRSRELVEALIIWGMLFISVMYLMLSRYVIFRFYPYVRISVRMIPILHLFLMFEIPFVAEMVLKRRSFRELGFSLSMPRYSDSFQGSFPLSSVILAQFPLVICFWVYLLLPSARNGSFAPPSNKKLKEH
jgi:glucan phosphoethanolaminetransferase (alkaline phosphatase superfamily)